VQISVQNKSSYLVSLQHQNNLFKDRIHKHLVGSENAKNFERYLKKKNFAAVCELNVRFKKMIKRNVLANLRK